jgi:hypothetical protein
MCLVRPFLLHPHVAKEQKNIKGPTLSETSFIHSLMTSPKALPLNTLTLGIST